MTATGISVICSELVALWLLWQLWHSQEPLVFKLPLSVLVFVPILGPLLVLWITRMPDPHLKAFRDEARYGADVFERWRHVWSEKDEAKRQAAWLALVKKYEDENP